MKIPKYKCGKVTPELYDIVLHLGREVIVSEVRLDHKSGFCNCSFGTLETGYYMNLDTPWTVEFLRRGHKS